MRNTGSNLTYYLAHGLSCRADIQASGVMHIDGVFRGTIKGHGVVIAGHHSVVEGDIEVDTVVLAGSFSGTIVSHEKICVLHCATVRGTIRAPICDVEHGARIHARMSIKLPA